MRLHEALDETATGALRRMASAHGLAHDDSTTRAELIERLAERLLSPGYLAAQVAASNDAERAVLRLARSSGGELRGLLVELDYPGAAEALAERGLLYRVFAAAGPLRGELFAAPEELLQGLPQPAPAVGPAADEPSPPAQERRASDPAFSLFCIASAVARGASLEAEVRAWSDEPGDWDWQARWSFLRHLAESAGLLVHRPDGPLGASRSLPRLLDQPAALFERLWRAYLRERDWVELAHVGHQDAEQLASTVQLRAALVDALAELPDSGWIRVDGVGDWLRRTRPKIIREQLTPRGLVQLESTDWAGLEQPLLRYLLLGPLYWLGVVSASADGVLVSRRPRADPRVAEPCVWEEPAELLAPPRAALGILLEAERYLVLRERGRPSRYHLVQAHVAAALGSGGSFDEGRRLLGRLTQAPLPEGIDRRLGLWEDRFGALAIRPAVLLEARSEADLEAALGDERVPPFVRARLSPTLAEVAAADALELAAALRAADHLPRVDAALRLAAEPRRAYAGLIDEQVLEYLLLSLLAFQLARPEQLAALEGSASLLARLERQFPPERLRQLRAAAAQLAGQLGSAAASVSSTPKRTRRRRA